MSSKHAPKLELNMGRPSTRW